jgi:hypothetical protein
MVCAACGSHRAACMRASLPVAKTRSGNLPMIHGSAKKIRYQDPYISSEISAKSRLTSTLGPHQRRLPLAIQDHYLRLQASVARHISPHPSGDCATALTHFPCSPLPHQPLIFHLIASHHFCRLGLSQRSTYPTSLQPYSPWTQVLQIQ